MREDKGQAWGLASKKRPTYHLTLMDIIALLPGCLGQGGERATEVTHYLALHAPSLFFADTHFSSFTSSFLSTWLSSTSTTGRFG
jgi:hypothetical protein